MRFRFFSLEDYFMIRLGELNKEKAMPRCAWPRLFCFHTSAPQAGVGLVLSYLAFSL
jgi:hypothetical protein